MKKNNQKRFHRIWKKDINEKNLSKEFVKLKKPIRQKTNNDKNDFIFSNIFISYLNEVKNEN